MPRAAAGLLWPTPALFGLGIALLAVGGLTTAARSRLFTVRVRGSSMEPTFRDGETLIAKRAPRRLRRGDIAVFAEPTPRNASHRSSGHAGRDAGTAADKVAWFADSLVVKRIAALGGDPAPPVIRATVGHGSVVPGDCVVVLSDNPAGIDSRVWGYIPRASVVGSVLFPRTRRTT